MSKNTRNRILLTAVAALLLVAVTVGGTLAYLTAVTDDVTNTFYPADIEIELKETEDPWTMQLIPGTEKKKDPTVTVKTSVDAYVFVQFTCNPEVAENGTIINYDFALNNGAKDAYGYEWKQLEGTDVWYTVVDGDDTGVIKTYTWELLTGNKVTVSPDATANDVKTGFVITFDAWAVQYAKTTVDGVVTEFEPDEAYTLVSGT